MFADKGTTITVQYGKKQDFSTHCELYEKDLNSGLSKAFKLLKHPKKAGLRSGRNITILTKMRTFVNHHHHHGLSSQSEDQEGVCSRRLLACLWLIRAMRDRKTQQSQLKV